MRTEELLSIDERTYVRKSFERNDGLRSTATGLTALAVFVLIISIVAGISIFNGYRAEGFSFGLAFSGIGISILLFVWRSSLRHQADSLDYQLMAAFPNWRELIDRQPPRDIKKEQK